MGVQAYRNHTKYISGSLEIMCRVYRMQSLKCIGCVGAKGLGIHLLQSDLMHHEDRYFEPTVTVNTVATSFSRLHVQIKCKFTTITCFITAAFQ